MGHCTMVVKAVFHLSLRATQGFLESVVKLMGVELQIPDYSTVSRRQAGLQVGLGIAIGTQPRHVVIDTPGLKWCRRMVRAQIRDGSGTTAYLAQAPSGGG